MFVSACVRFLLVCATLFGKSHRTCSSVSVQVDLPGHLKPVGFHRPAEIVIDEYTDPYELTPRLFYDQYVTKKKPVVFRGAAKHFRAFKEWTAEKLTEKYGSMELRIETRKDGAHKDVPYGALGIGRDTLANFLANRDKTDNYVVSELPTPMYGDVEILPCMSCGNLRSKISEINLWMSGGGSRSRLHRDAFNAINCQLAGTKDWIMVPNNQTENVYFVASSEYEMGGLSPVNADAVDLKKYPRFRNVPWGITTIEAGDCIFIPGGHYHQVRSYGLANIAVSVLFSRIELDVGFDSNGCQDAKHDFVSLDKISDILWQYPGKGMMSMGNMDDVLFRYMATNHNTKTKNIRLKTLMRNVDLDKKTAKQIFEVMDPHRDGVVTPEDLDKLPRTEWHKISHYLEPIYYANSELLEYARLEYSHVKKTLTKAFKKYGVMDRDDFVDIYHTMVEGSEHFGNKIFDQLDEKNTGIVSWDEATRQRLKEALHPFAIHIEELDEGNHYADGDDERSAFYDEEEDANQLMGKEDPGEEEQTEEEQTEEEQTEEEQTEEEQTEEEQTEEEQTEEEQTEEEQTKEEQTEEGEGAGVSQDFDGREDNFVSDFVDESHSEL